MPKDNRLKLWTLIIPLAIVLLFVALDIWPGKAIREFNVLSVRSNRELVGAFGEEDWEWKESGEGYRHDESRFVRHGRWTETHTDPFSGTWVCEGEYDRGLRDGRWTVTRNGEVFREFVFDDGRRVKVIRPEPPDQAPGR